jgi:methanogenic corrinoid protein MtbC1
MIAKTEVTDMDSTAASPIDHQYGQADAYATYFHATGAGGTPSSDSHRARQSRRRHPRKLRAPADDRCAALLARMIEARVLPRLVLAHRDETPNHASAATVATPLPSPGDVLLVGEIVLSGELQPAVDHLNRLVARGVTVESIYLDLLTPVARRLGELWCEDTLSFAEVTIGQVALQRLMRAFSTVFLSDAPPENPRRRILLSPMPGEQHAFGHFMVCDFFRRAGWMVSGDPCRTPTELRHAVHACWFEVIGISLSSTERLRELGALIHVLRGESRNATLMVMVGGKPFCDQPALAWQVGADACSIDARHAPARAEALLGMLAAT